MFTQEFLKNVTPLLPWFDCYRLDNFPAPVQCRLSFEYSPTLPELSLQNFWELNQEVKNSPFRFLRPTGHFWPQHDKSLPRRTSNGQICRTHPCPRCCHCCYRTYGTRKELGLAIGSQRFQRWFLKFINKRNSN